LFVNHFQHLRFKRPMNSILRSADAQVRERRDRFGAEHADEGIVFPRNDGAVENSRDAFDGIAFDDGVFAVAPDGADGAFRLGLPGQIR